MRAVLESVRMGLCAEGWGKDWGEGGAMRGEAMRYYPEAYL